MARSLVGSDDEVLIFNLYPVLLLFRVMVIVAFLSTPYTSSLDAPSSLLLLVFAISLSRKLMPAQTCIIVVSI